MSDYTSLNPKTQKQYDDLMVVLEERGYCWGTGNPPTDFPMYWGSYKERTCININESLKMLSYGTSTDYQGRKITNFDEYMKMWKKNFNRELIEAIHKVRGEEIG